MPYKVIRLTKSGKVARVGGNDYRSKEAAQRAIDTSKAFGEYPRSTKFKIQKVDRRKK